MRMGGEFAEFLVREVPQRRERAAGNVVPISVGTTSPAKGRGELRKRAATRPRGNALVLRGTLGSERDFGEDLS